MSLKEYINDIINPTLRHVDKAVDGATRLIVLGIESRASDEVEKIDRRV
jgi:hypothetical protein